MPFATVVEKLRGVPEEYLGEIADYIDSFKVRVLERTENKVDVAKSLFGIIPADITLEESRKERLGAI